MAPSQLSPPSTLRVSIADMIALGVRSRGRGSAELPETLYQRLPGSAMSIMATMPPGGFAVSIPGADRGYPILQAPPAAKGGFVIVYARKPNCRYEAVRVLFEGAAVEIAEFVGIARQRVESLTGSPEAVRGRYAYFAPTRDEWEVILRDNGYVAWNPSVLSSDVVPALGASCEMQNASAIVARIPVSVGTKCPEGDALPVFAQAQVLSGRSAWVDFAEYSKQRALRSRPPDRIAPDFGEWLSRLTAESGFECWVFRPGMLFGDCSEWWGDSCRRRTRHEGIDFAEGVKPGDAISRLPEEVPVRSIADGVVVAVFGDFLGKTVVLRHPAVTDESGDVFHTFYSHIQPSVRKWEVAAKGGIVGRTCKPANARVPAHLHLSGVWLPNTLAPEDISLDHIHPAFASVSLSDFKPLLRGNPLCRFTWS